MTNATKAKMKYNRGTYKRFEFNVNVDTELCYLLEDYMKNKSVSNLVKTLLCDYFKVNMDDSYSPYFYEIQNGEWVKVYNPLAKKY